MCERRCPSAHARESVQGMVEDARRRVEYNTVVDFNHKFGEKKHDHIVDSLPEEAVEVKAE